MAAQVIDTFVVVVENQEWSRGPVQVVSLENGPEFHYHLDQNIQTLSSRTAQTGDRMRGFLYVPDISEHDACYNVARNFIPANATRRADLPGPDFNLIGLIPWISADCIRSYLGSAHGDLIKAAIVYPTTHQFTKPPDISDPAWGLTDSGFLDSQNDFPVYAVPGGVGDQIMMHLSRFSGNMTDVESADNLTSIYDPRDYVRLYARINTGTRKPMPSFWVFLVIILGILLASVVLICATWRWILRKRRQALRRRVANGDVDLEALGIKRVQVPAEVVGEMPMFTYAARHARAEGLGHVRGCSQSSTGTYHEGMTDPTNHSISSNCLHVPNNSELSSEVSHPEGNADEAKTAVNTTSSTLSIKNHSDGESYIMPESPVLVHAEESYCQTTCAICLEDFNANGTTVRELPCGHIFHPDCVDAYLRNSSSLCPLCKKSVLPKGCCPTHVTDSMVRRERQVRRLRERVDVQRDGDSQSLTDFGETTSRGLASLKQRLARVIFVLRSREDPA